jgi:SMI1 / KNR4 family (SUKH-1)
MVITMIRNINDLRQELIIYKIAPEPYHLLGCTTQDIEQIENRYGTLPSSYKQIMSLLGRRAGKLVNRYEFNFYIDQLIALNEGIIETRKESIWEGEEILDLPKNVFFITSRYGDNIEFLLTNTEEDSPVYGYDCICGYENERPYFGVKEIYPSVWNWISSFVEDSKNIMALFESSPDLRRRYNY